MAIQKNRLPQLYISAIFVAILVVTLLTFVGGARFFSAAMPASEAVGGALDMSYVSFARSRPIVLAGEWRCAQGDQTVQGRLPDSFAETARLPEPVLANAQGLRTYALDMNLEPGESYALYMPYRDPDFRVYCDGVLLTDVTPRGEKTLADKHTLRLPDSARNLVVVANAAPGQALFYRNAFAIGTLEAVDSALAWDVGGAAFLLGVTLLLLMTGYLFVFVFPLNNMVAGMTLLETFLVIRVLCLSPALAMLISVAAGVTLPSALVARLEMASLCAALLVGSFFALERFWHDGKLARALVPLACGIGAVISLSAPLERGWFAAAAALATLPQLAVAYAAVRARAPRGPVSAYEAALLAACALLTADVWMTGAARPAFLEPMYAYGLLFIVNFVIRMLSTAREYAQAEDIAQNAERLIKERTSELAKTNARLSELSMRDPLTGSHNRLYFEKLMEDTFRQFESNPFEFYLGVLDLDLFKLVNDRFGHEAGDRALIRGASLIESLLPGDCEMARIGGEEMVIVTRGLSRDEVDTLLRGVCEAFRNCDFPHGERLTVSIGCARCVQGMDYRALFRAADESLYAAKAGGRDRVVMSA